MWCSKAPSEPNRLPAASRTPERSPARASAVPDTPPVATQNDSPPGGTVKRQCGSCSRRAVVSASAVSRSRVNWWARTAGRSSASSSAAISWSSTGAPTSL